MVKNEEKKTQTPLDYLKKTSQESLGVRVAFLEECSELLVAAAKKIGTCIESGGKILICGNGGSAGDSQHMAAEMVGKMLVARRPLPALALTTDTSAITAIANDFGYEHVFSRQVQALAKAEDILLAISTSGRSPNVIHAIQEARKRGCFIITLTGGSGGLLKELSDICLNVSLGKNSSRIQETHLFVIHSLVDLLDRFFLIDSTMES